MFQKVRAEVFSSTGGKQTPWESTSLMGNFYFMASVQGTPATTPKPQVAPPPSPPKPGETQDFDDVIEKRKKAEAEWAGWQSQMDAAFAKAERYEQDQRLKPQEKAEAWFSFLAAFSTDNTYSVRDDQLRAKAKTQELYWQQKAQQADLEKIAEEKKRLEEQKKLREEEERRKAELEAQHKKTEEERRRLEEEQQRQWAAWQERMDAEFAKVQKYDGESRLTSKEKANSWQEFLSGFGQDNPHSAKDETLRQHANARLDHWRRQAEAASTPPPTSIDAPPPATKPPKTEAAPTTTSPITSAATLADRLGVKTKDNSPLKISWEDYRSPLQKKIEVFLTDQETIVSVFIPENVLRSREYITLEIALSSATKLVNKNENSWTNFYPVLKVNKSVWSIYRIKVAETPPTQMRRLQIKSKYFQNGANELRFSWGSDLLNFSCVDGRCRYYITYMQFIESSEAGR